MIESQERGRPSSKQQRDRLGLIRKEGEEKRPNRWKAVRQYKTKITFHYKDSKEKVSADEYYFSKPAIVRVRDLTPEEIEKLPPPPPIIPTTQTLPPH